MSKKIIVKCSGHTELPIDVILEFQGGLKKLSKENLERLKSNILKNGFIAPIFVWDNAGDYMILDGHGRLKALLSFRQEGYDLPLIPVDYIHAESEKQARQMLLSITGQYGEFDHDELQEWIAGLDDGVLETLRLVDKEIEIMSREPEETEGDDEVPEEVEPITKLGDLWELGNHRLLCGDSTDADQVARLMDGNIGTIGLNDPPYGMKKEKDGIKNDNLNYADLLEFNKTWISIQLKLLKENASFYCFGIDQPLMDIYSDILKPLIKKQEATFRNLITWDKGSGQGQSAEEFRMYPIADEKIIFFMKGVQGFNNNSDNYFDGWEPIRKYIDDEIKKCKWTIKKVASFFGFHPRMADHWRSKSQFSLIKENQYNLLKEKAAGKAFNKSYEEIKKEYEEIKKEYYSTRAYFDNTHDNMNNVWHFKKTSTEEREDAGGHATPKPLALCERIITTSCPESEIIIDFFLGSGSSLIAAEKTGRICYGMELDEYYCDVTINRYIEWMKKNNREIKIKRNGEDFEP